MNGLSGYILGGALMLGVGSGWRVGERAIGPGVVDGTVEFAVNRDSGEPPGSEEAILPHAVDVERLLGRATLDASVADAIRSVHAGYAQRYAEWHVVETGHVRDAVDRLHGDVVDGLFRLENLRALFRQWQDSTQRLIGLEDTLWIEMTSERLMSTDVIESWRDERLCELLDLRVINMLPELKIPLRRLLEEAGIDVERTPGIRGVLDQHHHSRAVLLRRRVEAVLPTLRDFEAELARYGIPSYDWLLTLDRIDRADRYTSVISRSQALGMQRMYRANAALMQLLRRDAALVETRLDDDALRHRFRETVRRRLYPEIFESADPVEELAIRILHEGADEAEVHTHLELYRARLRDIEDRMVQRLIRYRDDYLALWNAPMLMEPMMEFDADFQQLTDERAAIRDRFHRLLAPLASDVPSSLD